MYRLSDHAVRVFSKKTADAKTLRHNPGFRERARRVAYDSVIWCEWEVCTLESRLDIHSGIPLGGARQITRQRHRTGSEVGRFRAHAQAGGVHFDSLEAGWYPS